MAKARWSPKDFKDNGLIEVNGTFVKASTQVAKKVDKIDPYKLADSIGRWLYGADLLPGMSKGLLSLGVTNKKIKNATKSVVDGISFDSALERYMYDLLKGANIHFEFQKTFILQDKFRYREENIRSITKIVDFWLPSRLIIIDTKGFSNDVSPIKHKMLKLALKRDYNMEPEIIMPSNKTECQAVLNRLLYEK